jgi:hypothetical protein
MLRQKKVGKLRAMLVPLDRSRLLLSKNLITSKKRTVQRGDAFEDTAFKPGFEIVKF